ncbi:MAG: hypothetical protein WD512_12800, partial [Candidatus Paceibacterota bacterium]
DRRGLQMNISKKLTDNELKERIKDVNKEIRNCLYGSLILLLSGAIPLIVINMISFWRYGYGITYLMLPLILFLSLFILVLAVLRYLGIIELKLILAFRELKKELKK